jgi:hypothetical protein
MYYCVQRGMEGAVTAFLGAVGFILDNVGQERNNGTCSLDTPNKV